MKREEFLKLGLKIKFERLKRNLTQEQLAEIAGMNTRSLSTIECGESNPRYSTLLNISKALKMRITELLDFKL